MSKNLIYLIVAATFVSFQIASSPMANAQVTVTVDSTATGTDDIGWSGFMSVFEIDRTAAVPAAGAFTFQDSWGFADLVAEFSGGNLTLSPNVIADPNEFWYQNTTGMAADPTSPGGPGQLGNRWMDASGFITTTDDLGGMTVTFEGTVLSNTLTSSHSAIAYIRDFAPDFSSFNETTVDLAEGPFSISLATDSAPGRNVQYGFTVRGENVWSTDVAPFGSVVIEDVGATALAGDFNGDGIVDCDDLDFFVGNLGVAATGTLEQLDLTGDSMVTIDDANMHITTLVETSNGVVGTFPGDLNCDGTVNVLGDAFALVADLGNNVSSYSQGDINFDGTVNVLGDAFALVANLGNSNN